MPSVSLLLHLFMTACFYYFCSQPKWLKANLQTTNLQLNNIRFENSHTKSTVLSFTQKSCNPLREPELKKNKIDSNPM